MVYGGHGQSLLLCIVLYCVYDQPCYKYRLAVGTGERFGGSHSCGQNLKHRVHSYNHVTCTEPFPHKCREVWDSPIKAVQDVT